MAEQTPTTVPLPTAPPPPVVTPAAPPTAASVPLVRSWVEGIGLLVKFGGGAVAVAVGLWSVYSSGRADALALELRIAGIERTASEHARRLEKFERDAVDAGRRLNDVDRRWERVDARLDEILRRMDRLDARMSGGAP